MKKYRVFKRGNVYRVAAPGRIFWHWLRHYSRGGYRCIYQTPWFTEAEKTMNELNLKEEIAMRYKLDRWTEKP